MQQLLSSSLSCSAAPSSTTKVCFAHPLQIRGHLDARCRRQHTHTHHLSAAVLLRCCRTIAVCAQNPGSVNSKCQLASLTDKLQKQGMHG